MKPRPVLLVLAACLLVLTGCSAGSSSDRPQVVASFYPLEFIATSIVGDHAEVTSLAAPGVEPHDLSLTPKQAVTLSGADLAFYEKGLSPAVDKTIAEDGPKHVVDVTSAVELTDRDGELDPHFWLDPTLMAKAATAFTRTMVRVDPDHADDYRANLKTLTGKLARLDREYAAGLKDCRIRTIVTSHDAFEYLGRRYDLSIEPIAGLSPDAEPSPKYLAQLSRLIARDKITTVFSEELASPKQAQTLASDLGITSAVLNPIEGLTKDQSGDYLSLMRENLTKLQAANRCS